MLKRRRAGWVAIAWAPQSRRSEMFARALEGRLHCVHYLRFQSPLHAPFKYVLQSVRTLQILFRDRPTAVHVQNPPFVCGLVVLLYCRIIGASFVTEHHSAAFDPAWAWARPVQAAIARRAAINIVTSEHWADIMTSWGAPSVVMHDPFLELPDGTAYPLEDGFNVAFVGTFASDEPIEEVIGAADLVPEVNLYITGDERKAPPGLRSRAPANVRFTGFLDMNREYLGLIRGVDAVMVLTTRDHTLQLAGCEAIAVGTPLITSDWAYLRDLFGGGTVFVSPTAESIAEGIRTMVEEHAELAAELGPFRLERRREWDERLDRLRSAVAGKGDGEALGMGAGSTMAGELGGRTMR